MPSLLGVGGIAVNNFRLQLDCQNREKCGTAAPRLSLKEDMVGRAHPTRRPPKGVPLLKAES